jgi:hypothetical protein
MSGGIAENPPIVPNKPQAAKKTFLSGLTEPVPILTRSKRQNKAGREFLSLRHFKGNPRIRREKTRIFPVNFWFVEDDFIVLGLGMWKTFYINLEGRGTFPCAFARSS